MVSVVGNLDFRKVQITFLVIKNMRILIDARMYGLEHAGIGRYVMNLVNQLQAVDKKNHYLVILRNSQAEKFEIRNSKLEIKVIDIPHYSLKEQIELPKLLNKLDFDLIHFPHFNVPIFFNRPYVLTIHDLIKHTSRGMPTTTRDPVLYWLKYLGYKIVFGSAITRAKKIIVPSNAVKEDLLKNYDIPDDKVVVTYEGVDEMFKSPITNHQSQKILKKYSLINKNYIIYTGSAYPHKNLERLIQAFRLLGSLALGSKNPNSPMAQRPDSLKLVIASSRNAFLERIISYARMHGVEKFVKFLGFVPDEELAVLYKNAIAFVSTSLSEGFGLPGLEAMAAGTPVVCSDIPVFHEIYGDAAVYFNPYDVQDIAKTISELIRSNDSNHRKMVERGKNRTKQFSWRKMTKETIRVYKDAMGYNFGK